MIEAMKQALEALESCGEGHITDGGNQWYDAKLVDTAIASLRQAIREHAMYEVQRLGQEIEQEAVALETVYETIIQWDEGGGKRSRRDLARRIIDLYTHPPQRTEQNFCSRCGKRTNDIHTCTPPQEKT